ncbi:EexN family lipoprotein [Pectobacterium aroidearum]|uniref:EexN family lipoprotein n=1 Tax=Pectobacterium aroidearum TaxID=1201031 RepID=A0ABR5ZDA2_9GAMM|nr:MULTISPECIES: EexN family lipoprotein [Enterobacterales]MDQ2230877.1 EexN family lipoprotein [Citrobacter portucalensis]HCA5746359.1 EexN family lipoprotein [Citrobacter freundii]MBA5199772.1 EexN family lipoprotein [Pectobacterium aroidearum]MBA5228236.1 EexN family lipoprotein [Pectobacterium aroidearum]MBA5232564.1 EexN family lipoprotein [Pectobacterium aroidearum]
MNKIIVILTLPFIVLISGCDEEAKTTQWYRDHPDELKVVYEKCQKTGSASENCKNVNEAHYQIQQLNAPTLKFHE